MSKFFAILALFITHISISQSDYVYREPIKDLAKAYEHLGREEIKAGIEYFDRINPSDSLYEFVQLNKIVTQFSGELYNDAIATCDVAIQEESAFESDAYFYKIKSLVKIKEYSKADKEIKTAFSKFPLMFPYDYLRAEMLYEQKKFSEATQLLQSIVTSHPQHSESHALLANIYAKQSKETEAILAYQMAIISNRSSNVLRNSFIEMEDVMKDNFEVTNEQKDHKEFKQINQLIKAKMALQNSYKASMSIMNYTNNVTDLIFNQFSYNSSSTYFPMKYYGKFLQDVKQAGLEKGYILYLIEVLNNPAVLKYKKKYSYQLEAFEKMLLKHYQYQVNANKFPVNGEIMDRDYILNEKGRLIGVGKLNENYDPVGHVTYFRATGKVSADLNYNDEGKLNGKNVWYNKDGLIKETGEYDNGKINGIGSYARRNGVMVYEGEFSEGKLKGEAKIFYNNGALHFIKNLDDREANGPTREFYSFGKLLASFNEKEDKIDGLYVSFYPNGDTLVIQNYIDGKESGKHIEYYTNRNISTEGAFKDGQKVGVWKDFYYEGNLKAKYHYKAGKLEGTYSEFSLNGDTLIHANYSNDLLVGEYKDYGEDNSLLWIHYYKKGKFKKYENYDDKGNILNEGKKEYVLNDRYGFKYIKATRKGNIYQGDYKVYWKSGGLKEHYLYDKKGVLNGESTTYFENGKKDESMFYKNGELHGEFKSYFDNGKVYMEGFYSNGQEVGEWKRYHANGELERTVYFKNGKRIGNITYYDLEGVKDQKYEYDDGILYKSKFYNPEGVLINEVKTPAGTGDYNLKGINGEKSIEGKLVGGNYHGKRTKFFPNVKVKEVCEMVHGEANGVFKSFYPNGQIKQEGTMEYGVKQGLWKSYHHNGNLAWKGVYENDYVRDSIQRYFLTGELREVSYYNKLGDMISEKNYHTSGALVCDIPYDRGFIHGNYSNYDAFGEVLINRQFNGGIEVGYTYEKDGKLIEMKSIQEENVVKAFYNNGKPSFSYTYNNGLYDGDYARFHSNGKKWIEANYVKGDIQGDRKAYYSTGVLRSEANYNLGRLNGLFKYYNKEGSLLLEETYVEGKKEGPAKYYDNNGKLLYTLAYKDDVVVEVK